MTHIKAMKLALEAFQRLDLWLKVRYQVGLVGFELDAIKALEEALAKQEQGEPVAWADHGVVNWIADKQFKHAALLYEHPQQRTWERPWVSLTDDEQTKLFTDWDEDKGWGPFIEAVEAKLKEKNT
jgi:hypothetical protein